MRMQAGCRDEESVIHVDMAHGEVGKSELSRVGLLLCQWPIGSAERRKSFAF
jgi:hypothetical protein